MAASISVCHPSVIMFSDSSSSSVRLHSGTIIVELSRGSGTVTCPLRLFPGLSAPTAAIEMWTPYSQLDGYGRGHKNQRFWCQRISLASLCQSGCLFSIAFESVPDAGACVWYPNTPPKLHPSNVDENWWVGMLMFLVWHLCGEPEPRGV